jgi:hypothetical protein
MVLLLLLLLTLQLLLGPGLLLLLLSLFCTAGKVVCVTNLLQRGEDSSRIPSTSDCRFWVINVHLAAAVCWSG